MYRKHDTYLVNSALELSGSVEVCSTISDKFSSDGVSFLNERASLQNSVLFFAYMCQYITYEELSVFLGRYFAGASVRECISILIEKKLVRKEVFSKGEGQSRSAFCLTKHGIETVLPLLPYNLPHNIKPRRSGRIVPLHDYYCGMNMLHFFISPLSYLWEKEVVFSNKLRPDIVLSMRTKNIPSRVFIEQDMGTEDKWVLLEKLNMYRALQLTEDSMVIYSMGTKLNAPDSDTGLARGFVRELISLMEDCQINSVFELYERYLREDDTVLSAAVSVLKNPQRFIEQFEEFLVWTGVCRSMGTPAGLLSYKNLNRYLNHDFSLSEVKRFYDDLKTPLNPYVNMYINRTNCMYSFNKYCALLELLFSYIGEASWEAVPYVASMLSGYPTYVVPTTLLSNYFPYIFTGAYDTVKGYVDSLKDYYPSITEECFMPAREKLFVRKDFPFLCIKDSFLVDGGLVVVATAYNMSALSQAMLLYNIHYRDLEKYAFIHFVFLVDEYEQAVRIHALLHAETYVSDGNFYPPEDRYLSCSYMLHRDCASVSAKKERLFGIYEYTAFGRTIYEPVYLFPKKYDTSEGHALIEKRQLSHYYDIPGYGDVMCSLREDIEDE